MDAAVYALIGTTMGALVPTTERIITAGRERGTKRAESREARLFEYKREAFTAYLSRLSQDLDDAWKHYNETEMGRAGAEVPSSALDQLRVLRSAVVLYCSDKTAQQAKATFTAVEKFVYSGKGPRYVTAYDSITEFARIARDDLGGN